MGKNALDPLSRLQRTLTHVTFPYLRNAHCGSPNVAMCEHCGATATTCLRP
jgi:hypothetical protein